MSSYDAFARAGSEIQLESGRAAAELARQNGQLWGGAVGNIGSLIANAPIRHAQMQRLQQEQQSGALDLQQKRSAIQANQILDAAYSKAFRPDGSLDETLIQQGLANTSAAHLWPDIHKKLQDAQKAGADLAKINGEVAEKERDHVAAVANAADTAPNPSDKAAALVLGLADGVKSGALSRDHATSFIQQLLGEDGNPDPAKVTAQLARMKAMSASDVEKRAQAASAASLTADRDAERPGKVAQSAITQQIAAGTVNGITPEQQITNQNLAADNARQDQQLGISRGQLAVAQQREKRENTAQNAGSAMAGITVPDAAPGQKNDAFLQTLSAPVASQVKAIAEGRMQIPGGAALRAPYWQNLLQAVAKYDPSFDAVNYNARSKTRSDFTSGKAAQQVNALNTVIGHLDNLSDAADALNNGNLQSVNKITNFFAKELGRPNITNFETVKKAVADEVTRVWRQSGGTEADIKAAGENLNAAGSPAQLHEAIATYGHLLESKLTSLNEQYRQGMGTDKIDMVTPAAVKTLSKLEQRAGGAPRQSAPAAVSVTAPNGKTYAFKTQAEADAFKAKAGIQ